MTVSTEQNTVGKKHTTMLQIHEFMKLNLWSLISTGALMLMSNQFTFPQSVHSSAFLDDTLLSPPISALPVPHLHSQLMTLLSTLSENCIRRTPTSTCCHGHTCAHNLCSLPCWCGYTVCAPSKGSPSACDTMLINSRILSQQCSPLSCSISFVFLFLYWLLSWLISIGLLHQHTNIPVLRPS